jgi:hypothetical protein
MTNDKFVITRDQAVECLNSGNKVYCKTEDHEHRVLWFNITEICTVDKRDAAFGFMSVKNELVLEYFIKMDNF